ncbi:hypothetical protein B9K06_12435 [Bacillus sp. OG2]|nr:hypothetical protein B9K06_12435 [Bacillus sp. OG2]
MNEFQSGVMDVNLNPFYDELEVAMKESLPLIPEGGNVLDIGCGKGWLTRLLYNNLNGNVIGIDRDRVNIDDCLNNADNLPIEYKVMDMVNLTSNYFLNSYSFITCHNVLGYISDPAEQLHKIYSWLQPEGVFSLVVRTPYGRFAEVYERSKSVTLALKRYKEMRMYGSLGDVFEFYHLPDLKRMIEVAGFSIVKSQGLYPLERYLPQGNAILKKILLESNSDEYFFQWILCKK